MYRRTQGFTGVYVGVHDNTGVYRRIHRCTYIWVNTRIKGLLQGYTWVYMRIQEFRGVYKGVHENTGVNRSIHG